MQIREQQRHCTLSTLSREQPEVLHKNKHKETEAYVLRKLVKIPQRSDKSGGKRLSILRSPGGSFLFLSLSLPFFFFPLPPPFPLFVSSCLLSYLCLFLPVSFPFFILFCFVPLKNVLSHLLYHPSFPCLSFFPIFGLFLCVLPLFLPSFFLVA